MSIYSLIDGVWGEKRISPVPSDSELAEYYRLKYFQADHAQYSKLYSTEERRWRLRKCEFIKSIALVSVGLWMSVKNLSASGFGRSPMGICKHPISSDF